MSICYYLLVKLLKVSLIHGYSWITVACSPARPSGGNCLLSTAVSMLRLFARCTLSSPRNIRRIIVNTWSSPPVDPFVTTRGQFCGFLRKKMNHLIPFGRDYFLLGSGKISPIQLPVEQIVLWQSPWLLQ